MATNALTTADHRAATVEERAFETICDIRATGSDMDRALDLYGILASYERLAANLPARSTRSVVWRMMLLNDHIDRVRSEAPEAMNDHFEALLADSRRVMNAVVDHLDTRHDDWTTTMWEFYLGTGSTQPAAC